MKNKLIILGAGGHGRVLADTAELTNNWSEIVFLDDRYPKLKSSGNWKVVGNSNDAENFLSVYSDAAVGIGDNQTRLNCLEKLLTLGFSLPVIAHPTAVISQYSTIAAGSVLFALTAVNFGAKLAMGCIVNTGAKIDHDCSLGKGVHLSPGVHIAGAVTIGDCSWIGIGAVVRPTILIGNNVIVGAGAAVINNLSAGITVVGVPARVLKKSNGTNYE